MPFCTNCGTQVQAGIKFCGNCGNAMQGGTPAKKTNTPLIITIVAVVLIIVIALLRCGNSISVHDPDYGYYDESTFTDPRDGKTYNTVKIGYQTWMVENLNYAASGSICYNNKPANCNEYGRLYDWFTAKAACPSGWHLPTSEEWGVLIAAVGGDETAGKYLKATSGWSNYGNGLDRYGFTALPGGCYNGDNFVNAGNYGLWWSSSENTSLEEDFEYGFVGGIFFLSMGYNYEKVIQDINEHGTLGISVRCLKD